MSISIQNQIQTNVATISLRPDNLVEIKFIDEYIVEKADIYEIHKAVQAIKPSNQYSILVLPGKYGDLAKEARGIDFYSGAESAPYAMGMVLPAVHQKILGRLYFKFVTKPQYLYKFFRSEEEAVSWLLYSA